MKSIFIPSVGYPNLDMINEKLKDCKEIIRDYSTEKGYILIIDTITRADKLKKINEISK